MLALQVLDLVCVPLTKKRRYSCSALLVEQSAVSVLSCPLRASLEAVGGN